MTTYTFVRPNFDVERMLDRRAHRLDPSYWTARSPNGVVATAHYLATAAGAAMLERGGNAIDAAVAASLALGVGEPAGSGLGGMTMMVVHLAEQHRTFTIAGPCRAPAAATPELVAEGGRYRGHRTVAVPANAAVLGHASAQYGMLRREDVLAPAIELAAVGYPISPLHEWLQRHYLAALNSGSAGEVFLGADGHPRLTGALLRQPILARTLRRLSAAGFEDFYRGEIARMIVADMEEHGGFIGMRDLTEIASVRELEPLMIEHAGLQVFTLGPPGGGLALAEMLNVHGALGLDSLDPDEPDACVLLASIIQRVRRDRRRYRLKTGAEDPGGAAELLTPDHARAAARRIQRALASGGETSHVSVIDRFGNVVAMTQSIERSFGAAELAPQLGFLYNGFLRAFKVVNTRHPHYLRPGTPARSNACPTIALREGTPWAVLGSTGSERATSGIFQALLRLISGQTHFEAVHAPRLHCTPEGEVLLESARFAPECRAALVRAGFRLTALDPYAFNVGGTQLASSLGGTHIGVADPRRDGAAAGGSPSS